MTEDDEHYKNNNICRFSEEEFFSHNVRDHCNLTGKYRGPAHGRCNINFTQNQKKFIPIVFYTFSKYDCHLFFKKLDDKKNDKVKIKVIPKTNENYIWVNYGSI